MPTTMSTFSSVPSVPLNPVVRMLHCQVCKSLFTQITDTDAQYITRIQFHIVLCMLEQRFGVRQLPKTARLAGDWHIIVRQDKWRTVGFEILCSTAGPRSTFVVHGIEGGPFATPSFGEAFKCFQQIV